MLSAVADEDIDPALALRAANAAAWLYHRDEVLTTNQKAGALIFAVRRFIVQMVRDAEKARAHQAADDGLEADVSIGTDGTE